ncbi:MAG: hypothetical protein ACE5QV_00545 [Fidelibacterota bacterium]
MKYNQTFYWIFAILAVASLIVGILAKAIGFEIFELKPLSYLRFTSVSLLFAIAVSLANMAFTKKE